MSNPANQPLADRIRPGSFEGVVGQQRVRERLERLAKAPRPSSLLLFGPPGCGKSTIALALAKTWGRPFVRISAPEAGLEKLRKLLGGQEVLVLDELHRFSKAQQDFFLPILESGEAVLIATTTENPSFSVTRQLLSRLFVLKLDPLRRDDLTELVRRGLAELGVDLDDEVVGLLAAAAAGDGRTALNLAEYAASLPEAERNLETVKSRLPEILLRHDKAGDSHYEIASALIKSIRGSDPDAALYWLGCLLEGGEDPRFITRRLILSASEDVGLADPTALPLAVACGQAVESVGMPEGFIPLAQTTVHLALAPKSNASYLAYNAVRREIKTNGARPVPLHLRNAATALQKSFGYGIGYKYPHDWPEAHVEQTYLPEGLENTRFYLPKSQGAEPKLNAWRARWAMRRT